MKIENKKWAIRFAGPAALSLGMLLTACGGSSDSTSDLAPEPTPHTTHPLRSSPPVVIDWYTPAGMAFGKGYSSVSGELAGTCVKGTVNPQPIGTLSANYDIQIVSDSAQLASSMGITAEASVGFGLFSASAKSSYLQSQASNSYSVYVIVRSEITGPAIVLTDARITKSNEDPSGQDNYNSLINQYLDFYSKCGDKYLAAATTGATYRGIIRLDTTSSNEKKELDSELRSRYGSATGSVDVKKAISQITSQYNVHINEFYDGVIPTSFATDYQTLLTNSQDFPTLFAAQCSGKSIGGTQLTCLKSANFQDYQTLSLEKVDTSALDKASANMQKLTNYAIGYQIKVNDFTTAQQNPYLFKDNEDTVRSMLADNLKALSRTKEILKRCSRDVRDCVDVATLNPTLSDPATVLSPNQIDLGKPTSCLDYKNRYQAFGSTQREKPLTDANYRMYIGGQNIRSANIWCADMNSTSPSEYISLVQPNTSRYRPALGGAIDITTWSKVRIDPVTLSIDPSDFRFARPVEGTNTILFGYAGDFSNNTTAQGSNIVSNGDLRGTSFQFSNSMPVATQSTAGGRVMRATSQEIELVAPRNGFTAFALGPNAGLTNVRLEFLNP